MSTDGYDNSVDAVSIAYITKYLTTIPTTRTNFLSACVSQIFI